MVFDIILKLFSPPSLWTHKIAYSTAVRPSAISHHQNALVCNTGHLKALQLVVCSSITQHGRHLKVHPSNILLFRHILFLFQRCGRSWKRQVQRWRRVMCCSFEREWWRNGIRGVMSRRLRTLRRRRQNMLVLRRHWGCLSGYGIVDLLLLLVMLLVGRWVAVSRLSPFLSSLYIFDQFGVTLGGVWWWCTNLLSLLVGIPYTWWNIMSWVYACGMGNANR